MVTPTISSLDRLAEASSLTDALHGIQQDLQSLREDVNHLKGNDSTPFLPQSGEERTLELTTPRSGVQGPADRILGNY